MNEIKKTGMEITHEEASAYAWGGINAQISFLGVTPSDVVATNIAMYAFHNNPYVVAEFVRGRLEATFTKQDSAHFDLWATKP